MQQMPLTLIKGDKHGSETDYRDSLPVNMYAVNRKIHQADGYMLNYPGLSSFGTGSGIDRGGVFNERLNNQYRVSGVKLISVALNGVTVELGNIPGSLQASMPYSFNTQAVIANGRMWLYSPAGGFNEIVDPDLGVPIDCIWVDGYYFLTDGEYLYHTDIDDETSIDPLNYGTAEFMPDPSLGLAKTQDNKVMVFGRYSLEYFVNDATDEFAFQRVATRAQKIGIVATHAKCEGESFYITGGRKNEAVGVYSIGIGNSIKISTREIDKILSEYAEPDLTDMQMEYRLENNVGFVLVHLPNETLCFNESVAKVFGIEAAWCILKTDVIGTDPYRGINGVFDARSAKWIYGDKIDTTIGVLDNTVTTHYDQLVEWILYTPFIGLETASIDELEIETIPGFTTVRDATVAFSITYDGVIYGREYWMQYGEPHDLNLRFISRRLGYISQWCGFKFRGVSSSRMAFSLAKVTYG
jgi:hypothetical protein